MHFRSIANGIGQWNAFPSITNGIGQWHACFDRLLMAYANEMHCFDLLLMDIGQLIALLIYYSWNIQCNAFAF